MRRVDVGDVHLLGDALPCEPGIPVVGVDVLVADLAVADRSEKAPHELVQVIVHVLLANEAGTPERDAPDPQVGAHVVVLRLVLETAGDDVDGITQVAELLCQLEDEHHLPAGVR